MHMCMESVIGRDLRAAATETRAKVGDSGLGRALGNIWILYSRCVFRRSLDKALQDVSAVTNAVPCLTVSAMRIWWMG